MRYLSVCSGIEAATVAWKDLDLDPVAFSEIEPFPCAVLDHHYPDVPNLGDMTQHEQWKLDSVDLLVGGTPCQSFSIAGQRAGLDDHRGNLTRVFLDIASQIQPTWLLWENVPGVLSIDDGRTFGAIIGTLAELGYGFAYRILDAQHFGVPQSRRRVFVVGYSGDWRPPAAVLFDRESLRGNPPKSRKTGEEIANTLTSRPASSGKGGYAGRNYCDELNLIANALPGHHFRGDLDNDTIITHCLRGESLDASEDGTGRGSPLVAFEESQRAEVRERDCIGALSGIRRGDARNETLLALSNRQDPDVRNIAPSCDAEGNGNAVATGSAVRRLTPKEWERLQGFPDDYTLINYNGNPAKDSPRYRAIGNSMAVPVMRWIGGRIKDVNRLVANRHTNCIA